MRTFLFGAGASHSYSQSLTRVRPPLARGLFDAYHRLAIAEDPYVRIGELVNYVRDTEGVDPTIFGTWNRDIEEFLTEVASLISKPTDFLALNLDQKHFLCRVYDQSVFLFCSVLNEIQNGPVCKNYSALVADLQKDDVLVTFNWDALLDRALYATGKWSPSDGYGLDFHAIYDNEWKRPQVADSHSEHKLLKLHGSTNWLMPYRSIDFRTGERCFTNHSIDPSTKPMFCFVKSDDTYKTYHNRSKAGYAPFSYYYYPPDIPVADEVLQPGRTKISMTLAYDLPDHGTVGRNDYSQTSMPMIIAPVKHKEYDLCDDALGTLWDLSKQAIQNCSELVIIGYSFPQTDGRAWELLDDAISLRGDKLNITVVDPYPEGILQRMKDRLGDRAVISVHSCSFADYVS